MRKRTVKSRSISDFSLCVFADKTRLTDGEPADGDDGSIQEVSGAVSGPMSVVRPLQSEDPGNEVLLKHKSPNGDDIDGPISTSAVQEGQFVPDV